MAVHSYRRIVAVNPVRPDNPNFNPAKPTPVEPSGVTSPIPPRATLEMQPEVWAWQQQETDPTRATWAIAAGSKALKDQYEAALQKYMNRGSGVSASDRLAMMKFEYEKQKDRAAAAKAQRELAALQDLYGRSQGESPVMGMISAEEGRRRGEIEDAYARALQNIGGGYEAARGTTEQGYAALADYLAGAQMDPYRQLTAMASTAPDAMENILSAYGTSAEPVLAQVAAERAAAEQGQANYQNLINVLSGVAQQGAVSRGAETQMARQLALQSLGQQQAAFGARAAEAQAQAVSQLLSQIAQSRIDEERRRQDLANQLALQIAQAGGGVPSGSGGGGGGGGNRGDDGSVDPEFGKPTIAEAIQALAAAQGMPVPTDQSDAALRRQLETGFLR